jgi:hypothetical protein
MALIEDQALPTTIEDVNIAAFAPDINQVASQFAEFYGAPSATTTPAGPGAPKLPTPVPGFSGPTQTITGPGGIEWEVGPTGITQVTPSVPAVTGKAAPFDMDAFMESIIPSVDPDAYALALEQQLATLGETEAFVAGETATEQARRESEIQADLAIQEASLAAAYAPRYDEIQAGLERAQQSAAFAAAGAGTVRGSRQAQKQVDLSQQAAKVEQALAAEQSMQLRLIEAQLRGEPDEVLDALKSRMSALSSTRQQIQTQMVLAEEELLGVQAAVAAQVQERRLQMILDNLDARGLTIDLFTGETVTTLEGEKLKSNFALTDAKTAEIYMKLQQPDLTVEYFSDEIGNTFANLVDLKTGIVETIELGKLSATQKWVIDALNAPVISGYGGTSGGGYGGTAAGTVAGVAGGPAAPGEVTDAISAAAEGLLDLGETIGSVGSSIKSGGELAMSLAAAGFSQSEQIAIVEAMYEMIPTPEKPPYYVMSAVAKDIKETAKSLYDMPTTVPYLKALPGVFSGIKGGLEGFFGNK